MIIWQEQQETKPGEANKATREVGEQGEKATHDINAVGQKAVEPFTD